MEFIKKNYLLLIFAVLIVVIIGLTVKIINCSPVSIVPANHEREYLLSKIKKDSLELIDITANYIRFKELAESKPKEIIIIKTKYVKIKDSINSLPIDGKVSALSNYLRSE